MVRGDTCRRYVLTLGMIALKHALTSSRVILFLTGTLLQKRKEVGFWFPATIPAPYEPPGSGLSMNLKYSAQGPSLTNFRNSVCKEEESAESPSLPVKVIE